MGASSINALVDFILAKYSVKAKYRIIELSQPDWRRLAIDRMETDRIAVQYRSEIERVMQGTLSDNESRELEEAISEGQKLEEQIRSEYGKIQTLEDYVETVAISVWKPRSIKQSMRKRRGSLRFSYKSYAQNKDVDFLMLLNSHLMSQDLPEEKMKTVAHEALHAVCNLRQRDRMTFKEIESEAEKVLSEFLKSHQFED